MAEEIVKSLTSESDRGAFILAATSIEDTLEFALAKKMPVLATDNAARNELFGGQGTISAYSDKTLLAYALGIIDGRARKDIDLVRHIRNACAHSRLPLTMNTEALVEAVKAALGEQTLSALANHEPATLRIMFIVHCAELASYVATGRRRLPLEAFRDELRQQWEDEAKAAAEREPSQNK
jgi:hypothetical protein